MQPLEFLRDLFGSINFNDNKSDDINYDLWVSIFSVLEYCESIEIDYICDHISRNKKFWKDSLVALPGTWFSNCPPSASKILKSLGWNQIPSYNEVKFSFISAGSYVNKLTSKNIKIKNPFLILRTPLTIKDWRIFDNNLNYFDRNLSEDHPIIHVSWIDSLWYCNQLSIKSKLDSCFVLEDESGHPRNKLKYQEIKFLGLNCNGYRLPTQIEWEYACLSGIENKDRYAGLNESAWWSGNSNRELQKVAQKKPNLWGLFDMLGNVNEWCLDGYEDGYLSSKEHHFKITKGGSYGTDDDDVKIFVNNSMIYQFAPLDTSFRPVKNIIYNNLYNPNINQDSINVSSDLKIKNERGKLVSLLIAYQKEKIKDSHKINIKNEIIDKQIYFHMYENQYQINDMLKNDNQNLNKNEIINNVSNINKNTKQITPLSKIDKKLDLIRNKNSKIKIDPILSNLDQKDPTLIDVNDKINNKLIHDKINSKQNQIINKNSIKNLNEQFNDDPNVLNLHEQFKDNVNNLNVLLKSTEININNLNILLKSTENNINDYENSKKLILSNLNQKNIETKIVESNLSQPIQDSQTKNSENYYSIELFNQKKKDESKIQKFLKNLIMSFFIFWGLDLNSIYYEYGKLNGLRSALVDILVVRFGGKKNDWLKIVYNCKEDEILILIQMASVNSKESIINFLNSK
jgi:hypothetical protein